jgi:putative transcriptional regulator
MAPRILFLIAAAAVLSVPPDARSAEDPRRLKPGVFLYAAPGLHDPNFAESVVLLVRHEAQGSMGLIINRPTRVPRREALTELGELRELDLSLHWGGPVQREAVLALLRSSKRLEGALRVLPDVHLCADLEQLKAAARQPEAAAFDASNGVTGPGIQSGRSK